MNKNTKEPIKIKLSTVIIVSAIVIILAIVVCIGIILINKNNRIKQMKEELSSLKETNKKLQNTIDEELGEDYIELDDYFDKLSNSGKNVYNSEEASTFSTEQIEEAIKKYIGISTQYYQSKEGLLLKLGLTTRDRVENYGKEIIANEYYSTDIKFDDYKEKMLNYVTEDYFLENFCDEIMSANGILYYSYYDAVDTWTYEIESLEKAEDEINTYEIKFKEKVHYDDDENEDYEDEDETYFIITSKDGNPIVQYTNFIF